MKRYTGVNKSQGIFKDLVPDDVWKQLILVVSKCLPADLHEACEVSGETGFPCKKNRTLNWNSDWDQHFCAYTELTMFTNIQKN